MNNISNYIVEKLHIDNKSATDSLIINIICLVCACHSKGFIKAVKKFLNEKNPNSIKDLEFIADAPNHFIMKGDEEIFNKYVNIVNNEEIEDFYDNLRTADMAFEDKGKAKRKVRIWHSYRDTKGEHKCCVFEYNITYSGSGWTILIR